jgi:Large ribosomal RNA subunit accumulation protein YceD
MPKSEGKMQPPWSVPVAQGEMPPSGRHFHIIAEEHTRAAVARLAGVLDLPRLEASFDLTPHGDNGLRVIGRVCATVTQTCSVSLEPMTSEVTEEFDLVFLPSPAGAPTTTRREVEVLLEDESEVLIDGKIDLGALATEFLMLGINPYPRKADSLFEAPRVESKSLGPFAALARLGKGRQ